MGAQSCSAQENKVTKKVTKAPERDLGTLLRLPPTPPPFLTLPQLLTLCLLPCSEKAVGAGLEEPKGTA